MSGVKQEHHCKQGRLCYVPLPPCSFLTCFPATMQHQSEYCNVRNTELQFNLILDTFFILHRKYITND